MAPRLALGTTAVVLIYFALTFVQVWRAAQVDAAAPAPVIVVLGAAQYDGVPSPVLRARLDHAAALYGRGLAPVVWVTGGSRPGDRFSEGIASYRYLRGEGLPDEALKVENTGATSWESLAATARFLRAEGTDEVILVSDPFHSYRISAIAGELGLQARVSPTPTSAITGLAEIRQLARETVAVAIGRIVGYRRLTGIEQRIDDSPIRR